MFNQTNTIKGNGDRANSRNLKYLKDNNDKFKLHLIKLKDELDTLKSKRKNRETDYENITRDKFIMNRTLLYDESGQLKKSLKKPNEKLLQPLTTKSGNGQKQINQEQKSKIHIKVRNKSCLRINQTSRNDVAPSQIAFTEQSQNKVQDKKFQNLLSLRSKSIDEDGLRKKKLKKKFQTIDHQQEVASFPESMILYSSKPQEKKQLPKRKKFIKLKNVKLKNKSRVDTMQPLHDPMFDTTEYFRTRNKSQVIDYPNSTKHSMQLSNKLNFLKEIKVRSQSELKQCTFRKTCSSNNSSLNLSSSRAKFKSPGEIVKPPPFKLKELEKYSSRLRLKDLKKRFFGTLLKGKYLNAKQYKQPVEEVHFNKYGSANVIQEYINNFDWKSSGFYLEMESYNNSSPTNQVPSMLLSETEISYHLSQLKVGNKDQYKSLFIKSLDTMKMLMLKLFNKEYCSELAEIIMIKYKKAFIRNEEETLGKLYYRCKMIYEITHQLKNIFRMLQKYKAQLANSYADQLKQRLRNQIKIMYQDIQFAFGGSKNQELFEEIKFYFDHEDHYQYLTAFAEQ